MPSISRCRKPGAKTESGPGERSQPLGEDSVAGPHPEKGGGKQHISRVLFTATGPGGRAAGVTICLGPPLPAASSGTGGTERERWPTLVPRAEALALLLAGVYRAGTSRCRWCALTAPLHPYLCRPADRGPPTAIGGVFLWHCPHGRPHRALPGRPGHRGARTFLNRPDRSWVETRQRSTDRDHLGCFPGSRLRSRLPARSTMPQLTAGGRASAGDRLAVMGL